MIRVVGIRGERFIFESGVKTQRKKKGVNNIRGWEPRGGLAQGIYDLLAPSKLEPFLR